MSSDHPLKVVLFLGSTREGRMGARVARFMEGVLFQSNHEVQVFDPLVMNFPLLRKPLFEYDDENEAPVWLVEAATKLKQADAVVVVSAEYNHSVPPALVNMLDHFGRSCYSYKPSGIVCYSQGIYGGMRAAMQLRSLLGTLGCLSVSNIFGIPRVQEALAEDGSPKNDHMKSGAERLIDQLDWHAHAMRNHRLLCEKEGRGNHKAAEGDSVMDFITNVFKSLEPET